MPSRNPAFGRRLRQLLDASPLSQEQVGEALAAYPPGRAYTGAAIGALKRGENDTSPEVTWALEHLLEAPGQLAGLLGYSAPPDDWAVPAERPEPRRRRRPPGTTVDERLSALEEAMRLVLARLDQLDTSADAGRAGR